MDLLERDEEQAALRAAIDAGRIVVVSGEAGIGKTALVQSIVSDGLWGGCDPLITPRPLGPLHDVARQTGGALAAALADGSREAVLSATLDALERSTLVIEDLHWADDATLDLVALVGRRLALPERTAPPPVHDNGRAPARAARGCLILTVRPAARPEVARVLASLRAERIEPGALSTRAVATLAERAGREPGDLHALTGGNPFLVTEALASGHNAILLRVAALSDDARPVVELVSVVPGAAELWLIDRRADAIDECVAAGLLHVEDDRLAFRHDLARRAVEESVSPARRRELNRHVLSALERAGHQDPARLAHHARRAGDYDAIRRHAPAAARAAAAAHGHRQALEHWEAALAVGAGEEALVGVATEAYVCGRTERAIEARRALIERHADDPLRLGDDLRWLSRLLWWSGQGAEALEVGQRAIAVLEAFPRSRELAMALSAQSQLRMLHERNQEAIPLGERAAELARAIGDDETLSHALANVGSSLIGGPEHERGRELLAEAHRIAVAIGHDEHAARAVVNLATATFFRHRMDPRTPDDIEQALAFVRAHELDGYHQYMLGVRANFRLYRGEWRGAEADARASLAFGEQPNVSICPALVVLGRLQARRGEDDATATLDEAWRVAVATGELQRLAPVAIARAENAWLNDALEPDQLREVYALADARGEHWSRAEVAFWLRRAGVAMPPHRDDPEPLARAAAADFRGAAEAYRALGFPYEAATVLSEGDEEARLEALAVFDTLGATRVAAHLRRRLRADGVRRIPRGPRPASRATPGGLTPRECEVLTHLRDGATNAEIARALVISPKTVDHHVSAVLGKLGAASRRELLARRG